jgi:hypothetical protein
LPELEASNIDPPGGGMSTPHGFKETKASIANKLARVSLPAAFFLACLAAVELGGVALEDLKAPLSRKSPINENCLIRPMPPGYARRFT